MLRVKSIRGVCIICKQVDVTNYHYSRAHGLVPRELFAYRSESRLWTCRKHGLASLNPHCMMEHFWREHMHAHPSKLPYKTREPMEIKPTFKKETPVTVNTPDNPPITAEAIVSAFEDRVKDIDGALEAQESTITALKERLTRATSALVVAAEDYNKEIAGIRAERDSLREYKLRNEQASPDGLVARLFKR